MKSDDELAREIELATSRLPSADEAWRAMGRAIEHARPHGDNQQLLARLTSEMDKEMRAGSNRPRVSPWPYLVAASVLVGVAAISSYFMNEETTDPAPVVALEPLAPWHDPLDEEIVAVHAAAVEPLFAMSIPVETAWLEEQVALLSAEVDSGEF